MDELKDPVSRFVYDMMTQKLHIPARAAFGLIRRGARDHARTPMQWTSDDNCGFSKGQPWMRINPNHKEISVEKQRGDAASILSFYKAMLALRKDARFRDTFVYGNFEPLFENEHELMAYCRNGSRKILVIANFRKADRKILLPYEPQEILLGNYEEHVQLEGNAIALRGYEFVVMEVKR